MMKPNILGLSAPDGNYVGGGERYEFYEKRKPKDSKTKVVSRKKATKSFTFDGGNSKPGCSGSRCVRQCILKAPSGATGECILVGAFRIRSTCQSRRHTETWECGMPCTALERTLSQRVLTFKI